MANSIYTLSCNPYENPDCTTTPAQTMLDVDTAVCAYSYVDKNGSPSCTNYSMITYASRQDAEAAKSVVTHEGACGLCSTTIDLALYLSKNIFSLSLII